MNNQLPQLILGDVIVPVPVIQGGMGVGVSRSRLAGAVAKEGGIGVISTAQIGYDEENFEKNPAECNRRAIIKHIAQAKEIAGGNGLVGVNIMVALKHYRQHIETAVEAGADVIICGAGLPADLPGIAQNYAREHGKKIPKLMPIVSSARAAGIILKMWDHHYHTVPDCIIVEGPMAGGHLGFQESVLENIENIDFDAILCGVIDSKKPYEEKYTKKIPVAAAGGIFDRQDIDHVLSLGADAVQIASRFVVTKECDASDAYKRAYIDADVRPALPGPSDDEEPAEEQTEETQPAEGEGTDEPTEEQSGEPAEEEPEDITDDILGDTDTEGYDYEDPEE